MTAEEEEFPWPGPKDRLFKSKPPNRRLKPGQGDSSEETPTGRRFARYDNQMPDLRYREGWFWAAENLAWDLQRKDAIEKEDPGRLLFGVYLPMLYCYRHYLEVSLKHLINQFAQLSDLEVKDEVRKEHGLMPLWNETKRLVTDVLKQPACGTNDPDRDAERLINEFHQFDPTSQTFRYRSSMSGQTHEKSVPRADLASLIRIMRGLKNFFEGLSHCADEEESYRKDWEAEC